MKLRGRAGNRIRIPVIRMIILSRICIAIARRLFPLFISLLIFPIATPRARLLGLVLRLRIQISKVADLRPSRIDFETRLRIGVRFSD